MKYKDNWKPKFQFGVQVDLACTSSQHFKLKMKDIGQPFVAYLAIYASIQEGHDQLMVPKHHSRLTQGLGKAATETRLVTLEQGIQ